MRLLLFNLATDADDSALGFAIAWIAELARHAAAIDVLTMRSGRFELPAHVCVYSIGKEKGYSEPRRFIEFYRILFRLVRQHRYDACFAHMMPLFVAMAGPILRAKKIPIVLWYAHKSVTPVLRLATVFAQRVVTSVQEGFRLKTKKLRIIGQGIDVNLFVPDACIVNEIRALNLITVGRISPTKRIDCVLRGVAHFVRIHPEIPLHFTIVGRPLTPHDEQHFQHLQAYVTTSRLVERIRFEGSAPYRHLVPYYQRADCFITMSDTGSIDKVVLEAMSCGVIPIMTNRSLTRALGEQLAALCLIDATPEDLAAHLFRVYSLSCDERRNIGRQLREIIVQDHSLQKLSQKILDECISAHQARRKKPDAGE